MEKMDLAKRYKTYYSASAEPELVDIEQAQFLSIMGKGDPGQTPFEEKIRALYGVAHAIRALCQEQGRDFTIARLECLWDFNEERYGNLPWPEASLVVPRNEWGYCLMIRMPDFVTHARVLEAKEQLIWARGWVLAREIDLHIRIGERVVQMLHMGPRVKDTEALIQMEGFMWEHHLEKNGPHHEIYLPDFERTAPQRRKTILRGAVRERMWHNKETSPRLLPVLST